jgi:2-amino-4-hydroxy-6-hydroxymethyldihydropteridine diphosphokinase
MARVWIGLGSNVGDRLENLRRGLSCLDRLAGTRVAVVSSVYECEPVGKTDQPWFMNAVAEIETGLEPRDLLREILRIERLCGRERLERWGPRTLDLDILIYGNRVESEAGLVIPHERLTERAFALLPLSEIAPDLVVPGRGVTVSRLVEALPEGGPAVRRVEGPPAPNARS